MSSSGKVAALVEAAGVLHRSHTGAGEFAACAHPVCIAAFALSPDEVRLADGAGELAAATEAITARANSILTGYDTSIPYPLVARARIALRACGKGEG